jgi:hypothetical protein
MQIKLIADNNKELAFTEQLPDIVNDYLVPGASSLSASGVFGHVLFQ